MTSDESHFWLMDEARRALSTARLVFQAGDHVATVQHGQACVEYCARALIHSAHEPSWGHSHGRDLDGVLRAYGRDIRARFGPEMINDIRRLAADDREMAPWHTRAMYGFRDPGDRVHPPLKICTPEVAERAVLLAERSLATAERFIAEWGAAA